jgi:nicotinamide mononucleotide transporter
VPPELLLAFEWSAVALNIGFTILIALEKRPGWLLGFVAALLSMMVYAAKDAWLMTVLNAFYAGMGLYGWWSWGRDAVSKPIVEFPFPKHTALLLLGCGITVSLWATMRWMRIPGDFQFMEAFVAAFAIIATWMMSAKVLSNWIYWTIGDLVSVVYSELLDLHGYALLNAVYIGLALAGYVRWRRAYRDQMVGRASTAS